jgi:hypothetical protein
MYRLIHPGDHQELPLRMLFHPVGEGVYLKACEADSVRGLVAALLDDPAYEATAPQFRLVERIRTIVIVSDHTFIRSLNQAGFVSLTQA